MRPQYDGILQHFSRDVTGYLIANYQGGE